MTSYARPCISHARVENLYGGTWHFSWFDLQLVSPPFTDEDPKRCPHMLLPVNAMMILSLHE
jgi:hypothetical protein